jgi:nitroimidazol reductase NimA-like FMN-containing flavoprotein (pyridoxamine 5'-phosphate oxidase superfamily)
MTDVDRNGLEILDRDECLRLLTTATIGRIGLTSEALPVVLPINFRLVGDRITFLTGVGSKLDAATANAIVSFEADDFDSMSHSGWSVVVTGAVREVTDVKRVAALRSAHIPRWAPAGDARVVEVATERISGRRITHGGAVNR